ncbi:hypothetical protein TNCV_823871 [Trichonephila clavipes]|nr:hypothetical protein TNCV_823871 [Trichonephila clavipes]
MTHKTKSIGKPFEILATVGHILRHQERIEIVVHFCLTTRHGLLRVYIYWLGLAANKACPLGGHAGMFDDHMLQCTGFNEYPAEDVASRYLDVRHQMVKKPSTGIG